MPIQNNIFRRLIVFVVFARGAACTPLFYIVAQTSSRLGVASQSKSTDVVSICSLLTCCAADVTTPPAAVASCNGSHLIPRSGRRNKYPQHRGPEKCPPECPAPRG